MFAVVLAFIVAARQENLLEAGEAPQSESDTARAGG